MGLGAALPLPHFFGSTMFAFVPIASVLFAALVPPNSALQQTLAPLRSASALRAGLRRAAELRRYAD